MAIKKPAKLTVTLNADTGSSKKDKITYDATVKLSKLDASNTLEWFDSTTETWESVDTLLLSSVDANKKTALLNIADLLGEDFANQTLEFRQVNTTGTASDATSLTFTYDTTAPELIEIIPPDVDTILNKGTSVVRITSNEKLTGLDAKDFSLSSTLASIKSVKETKISDEEWAYNVTISAASKGNGDVSLMFASTAAATDIAGNAIDFSAFIETPLANFWIGNDSLLVSLVEDTGPSFVKKANKDGITHNGEIKLDAIKPDALVEFRIKAGSASIPDGLDEWLTIDDLSMDGSSATVDLAYLYELAGLSLDDMPMGGWKDTFEFHQVNVETDKASMISTLAFTYDVIAPTITDSMTDADTLLNGKTTVVHLYSDEQLQGIDKADFAFSDTTLASIKSVSKGKFDTTTEQWVYDVTVLASKGSVSGATTLKLADNASITDLAGNAADASNFSEGLADFWIGKYDDKLSVSLVEDTSSSAVNSNKDGITYNGMIKLNGIKSDTVIEFRIKPDSASLPDGSGDEWITIDLDETGISATLDSVYLYELAGVSLDEMPPTGWKDTFEFHQVNQTTGKMSEATPITFTYDSVAAYIDYIEMDSGDTLPNGETTIIHLYSSEKLQGLDKNDFTLSDPSLASIKSVTGALDNDLQQWVYDVAVSSTSEELGGITTLQLSENASVTDVAGNEFGFEGYDIPVGDVIMSFTATLDGDYGVSDQDNITDFAAFKFTGVIANTSIEFRLKEGSESSENGYGQDWSTIPNELLDYYSDDTDVYAYYWQLYDLIGVNYWDEVDGLEDIWEFRQVDADGQVLETAEPLTVTIDTWHPTLINSDVLEPIQNGQTRTIQFLTEEQIFGLTKDTIQINNSALASITDIQEYQLDDGQWAYDISVKATTNGQGELILSLPPTSHATDAAGNQATLMRDDYNYAIWVGENPDAPVASLVNDAGVKGDNITNNNQLRIYGITSTDTLEFRFKENSTIYPLLNEEERQDWRSVNDIRHISGNVALVESVMDRQGMEYWSNEYPAGFTQAYEFRKVDAEGNISAVSDEFIFTFDRTAPEIDVIMDNPVIPNAGSAVVRLLSTERLMSVDENAIWLEDPQHLASVVSVNEVSMANEQWAYDITLQVGTDGNGMVRGGLLWSNNNGEVATDLAGNHPYTEFTFWAGSNPPDMTATLSYDSGESDSDNITRDVVFRLDAIDHSKTQEVRLKSGSEFAPNGTDWFSIPADFFIYNQGFSKSVAGSELYRLLNNNEYLNWETIPVDGLTDIWEFRQQGDNTTSSVTVMYDPIATQITELETSTSTIARGETGLLQFTSNEQLVDLALNNFRIYDDQSDSAFVTDIQETQVSDNEWQYAVEVTATDSGDDELVNILFSHGDVAGNYVGQYFDIWISA